MLTASPTAVVRLTGAPGVRIRSLLGAAGHPFGEIFPQPSRFVRHADLHYQTG